MPTTNLRRCDGCGSRQGFGARFASEPPPSPVYRDRRWAPLRARVLAAWVRDHGWLCPGWRKAPHAVRVNGLTLDHVVGLAQGGAPFDPANLSPLCQSCNSSKALAQLGRGRRPAG